MPGAPHHGPSRPITERSTAGVVWLFIVFPVLFGGLVATVAVTLAVKAARESGAIDWCGLVWLGLLVLGLTTALPATGLRELRRRRQNRPR